MTDIESSAARQRVLDAAEKLFAERGYRSVTLRDIAAEVGIKHTSLYHHVPGGKEQMYIEVIERHLQRHNAGLTQAIEQAEPNIRAQLYAVADWLLSQPPVDLVRLTYSDLPEINPVQEKRLSSLAYASLIAPIEGVLSQAQTRGEIRHHNLGLIAGGLIAMIESMYSVPEQALEESRVQMAYHLVDVVLDGLRLR